jgi:hypothetical protein
VGAEDRPGFPEAAREDLTLLSRISWPHEMNLVCREIYVCDHTMQ